VLTLRFNIFTKLFRTNNHVALTLYEQTLGLIIDLSFSANSLPMLKLYFKVQYLISKFDLYIPINIFKKNKTVKQMFTYISKQK
jgi:hypothetical protein